MRHQVIAALAVLSAVGLVAWRHSHEDFEAFALLVAVYGGIASIVGLSLALAGMENLWKRQVKLRNRYQEACKEDLMSRNESERRSSGES